MRKAAPFVSLSLLSCDRFGGARYNLEKGNLEKDASGAAETSSI